MKHISFFIFVFVLAVCLGLLIHLIPVILFPIFDFITSVAHVVWEKFLDLNYWGKVIVMAAVVALVVTCLPER